MLHNYIGYYKILILKIKIYIKIKKKIFSSKNKYKNLIKIFQNYN